MNDILQVQGVYTFYCWLDGQLLWTRTIHNVVATVGKNLAFDTFLNGSNYTVTGPYMGLIDAASFTAVAASDTMTSHPGWIEASYYSLRQICDWAAAANGAIAVSEPCNFTITTGGTAQGAFIDYGPGAIATVGDTGGTLWSAGAFVGGPAIVPHGSTLQVYYSVSM